MRYAAELTGSRTANLLLLPLELAWLATRGYRVLHVHWTWSFCFTGSDRRPALRRASRVWFGFVLWSARRTGLRVVWTAHNILPHAPVFDDDARARVTLIRSCSLVIAHSAWALRELSARFGAPARGVVIPHGPIEPGGLSGLGPPGASQPRSLLCFGRIEPYKGVEDLLAVAAELGGALRIHVAGRCADPGLRARLQRAAAGADGVTLSLRHVADADIRHLFEAADAVVYPYREVATSGSVTLAQLAGRAVVIPDLPAFGELPDAGVIRYPPGVDGLRSALRSLATLGSEQLIGIGRAARLASESVSWDEIAELTADALAGALARPPGEP